MSSYTSISYCSRENRQGDKVLVQGLLLSIELTSKTDSLNFLSGTGDRGKSPVRYP